MAAGGRIPWSLPSINFDYVTQMFLISIFGGFAFLFVSLNKYREDLHKFDVYHNGQRYNARIVSWYRGQRSITRVNVEFVDKYGAELKRDIPILYMWNWHSCFSHNSTVLNCNEATIAHKDGPEPDAFFVIDFDQPSGMNSTFGTWKFMGPMGALMIAGGLVGLLIRWVRSKRAVEAANHGSAT